ncbi:hypothetical protein ACFWCB_15805 [Streptomyces sp. NPDC060048]|uniref:hypothetical protein n=1 Tax=unclassified Streptomyces TaxID=2593676 RepID=UPI00367552D2
MSLEPSATRVGRVFCFMMFLPGRLPRTNWRLLVGSCATHRADQASLAEVAAGSCEEFLVQRRRLMAAILRDSFQAL